MCVKSHSESGQPCGFEPCDEFRRLRADLILNITAAGNAEDKVKALLEKVSQCESENATLRQDLDDTRYALDVSEKKLTGIHLVANDLRQEISGLDSINRNLNRELERINAEKDSFLAFLEGMKFKNLNGIGMAGPEVAFLIGESVRNALIKEFSEEVGPWIKKEG